MENTIAILALTSALLALICLLVLHFTSPEFQPSWRMISEYALGKYKWLITSFFLLWGTSSILLAVLLWPLVTSTWAMVGVVLLVISAIGEIMGGLFDVKHKLHGLSFLLGVPSLPIAALLITGNVVQLEGWHADSSMAWYSAHSTWITLVLMGVAMAVMMNGFNKAGIPMEQNAPVPERVPDGAIAWAGYTNRLLVLCYIGWLVIVALGLRGV
jgi:hypothetical protein